MLRKYLGPIAIVLASMAVPAAAQTNQPPPVFTSTEKGVIARNEALSTRVKTDP